MGEENGGGDMHAGAGGIENGVEDIAIGNVGTIGTVGPGGARFIARAAEFACAAGDLTPGRRKPDSLTILKAFSALPGWNGAARGAHAQRIAGPR